MRQLFFYSCRILQKSTRECLNLTKNLSFDTKKSLCVFHSERGNFRRLHPTQTRNFLKPPLCKGRGTALAVEGLELINLEKSLCVFHCECGDFRRLHPA